MFSWSGRRESNPRPTAWKAVTLPLSYSRPSSKLEIRNSISAPNFHYRSSFEFPISSFDFQTGGQGRVRTSVDHRGRQIYSLLLLTTQPPVRPGSSFPAPRQIRAQSSPHPIKSVSFEPRGSRMRLGADTHAPRAILNNPDLINPLPNQPTGDRSPDSCD